MRHQHVLYVPALAASLMFCSPAFSATASPVHPQNGSAAPEAGTVRQQDQNFIDTAWNINTTEIRLGTIAQKNASDEDVKAFGERMVVDHTKLNEELTKVATESGATLPTTLSKEHQEMIDRLAKLSGSEFDKQYMTGMIAGHEHAIALFQKESQEKEKAQTSVEKWAGQAEMVIEDHLQLAKLTGKVIGVSAAETPAEVAGNQGS